MQRFVWTPTFQKLARLVAVDQWEQMASKATIFSTCFVGWQPPSCGFQLTQLSSTKILCWQEYHQYLPNYPAKCQDERVRWAVGRVAEVCAVVGAAGIQCRRRIFTLRYPEGGGLDLNYFWGTSCAGDWLMTAS